MTVRKPTETMTVPTRLFTGEGHFVEETWMAGLRPTLAYFVPFLSTSCFSFSYHVSLKLVRIQMFVGDVRRRTRIELPALNWRPVKRRRMTRCYGTRREESRTPSGEKTPLFISFHEI